MKAKCYECVNCLSMKKENMFNLPDIVDENIKSFLTCECMDKHMDDNYLYLRMNPWELNIKQLKEIIHGNHEHFEVLKRYIKIHSHIRIVYVYNHLWNVHYLIEYINNTFIKSGNVFVYRNKIYNEVDIVLDIISIVLDKYTNYYLEDEKFFKGKAYNCVAFLKTNIGKIKLGLRK